MRDPIELEIAKNALTSIAEEMAVVALKSAFSIILKESGDASSAICDRYGRLVAQTASATLYHLASFRPSLRELIADFPLETMNPGDVFVFNDQFRGGIHANDILVFTPVFNAGEVVFFTCDLMHVADLGGVSAGGLPSNATEFYHEGLRLPPLRLYRAGLPNDDLVRIIKANSRTPDKVIGDIRAMVAGNHVGARRLAELIGKYGTDRLLEICGELIDYTEVLTRQEIAKIPSGVYEGSYVVEEDGVVPDKTYRVKVKVTIDGSDCHVDFTGTDPQARGPINAATSQTMSGVIFALRCFMDPSIPLNEGCFRPLRVTLPEGTLVNPRPPAACNVRLATVQAAIDSIHQALARAFPEKAVGLPGSVHVYTMSGRDAASGRAWSYIDAHTGSEGGRTRNDGLDGQPYPLFGVDGWGVSLEAYEVEYPVLFKRYGYWPDSGGPGRMRGGAGVIKQIQMLEGGEATIRAVDRCRIPPQGVAGGKPGKGGGWTLNWGSDDERELPKKQTNLPLKAGDVLTMFTSGGGGLGDPLERDPYKVAKDAAEGLISPQSAVSDYGVVLTPGGEPDLEATAALRARAKARGKGANA